MQAIFYWQCFLESGLNLYFSVFTIHPSAAYLHIELLTNVEAEMKVYIGFHNRLFMIGQFQSIGQKMLKHL